MALLFGCLPFVLRSIYVIFNYHTINYSEDSLLASALELAAGHNPYASYQYRNPPYILTPYPPVYYITIVPFLKLAGASLIPGRIVSIVSSLLISVVIYLVVRREGNDRQASIIGALTYLGLYPACTWGTHHRVDNLTYLFALTGLYLGTAKGASGRRLIAALAFLLLSILTKQSSVMAFLVVVFCLWRENKKKAILFASGFVAIWALIFILLNRISDGGYYFNIITSLSSNPMEWERLRNLTITEFSSVKNGFAVLLVICALSAGWIKPNRWVLYTALTLSQGLLTIGKIGSGPNYFLESTLALSILVGLIFARLRQDEKPGKLFMAIVSLAQIAAVIGGHFQGEDYVRSYLDKIQSARDASQEFTMEDYIKQNSRPGDMILTQRIDLALFLDRVPVMNDPFTFSLLAGLGKWDESGLVDMVRSGSIPLVILETGPVGIGGNRFLSETLKSELPKHYEFSARLNFLYFYKPIKR